jgi:hypothetical protein
MPVSRAATLFDKKFGIWVVRVVTRVQKIGERDVPK